MTISELTLKDLKHIKGRYWYSSFNGVKNIFYVIIDYRDNIKEIEPVDLKEMLIDLSDKVPFGNSFVSVVECLNINYEFMLEAKLLDEELMYSFAS
jgi:hypothetical protein